MKIGISISTHSDENTPIGRYNIIEQCFQSLLDNKPDDLLINIVSDGITEKHLEIINKFPFIHIEKRENTGISKTKNTGIKYLLDNGCDIGFLSDDDIIFKSKRVFDVYTKAIQETHIPHFSLFVQDDGKNCERKTINGYDIKKTPWVNGCFLTFTKELIEEIGYFKVLTYKYGHEHSNFSRRCLHYKKSPFWCDIINSHDLIGINHLSFSSNSMGDTIDQSLFEKNLQESYKNLDEYVKLIEY